jgi:molecular chaperone DnaK (HSP70)
VTLAGRELPLADLLTGFLDHLRRELIQRSNAGIAAGERLEAAVSVPANSSSAQRFLTLEAFKRAGFEVVALLNEPSAAGFEYAHRFRSTITSRREYVLVHDLGGGTFDASLLKMSGRANEVVTSEGVRRLGGDDFDEAILRLVLDATGRMELDTTRRAQLLEECARQKETVGPNTKRFLVDLSVLGLSPLSIPMDEVYAACVPLVERTLDAMAPALRDPRRGQEQTVDWNEVAGIYIVGGAGTFPLVPRLLKEKFGEKRVKRSPHPFAATAIGLAISLDQEAGYTLSERFSRTFGVFRESEEGGNVTFDPIFTKDTPLPPPDEPPLSATRRYRAAHNIGHFRFLECSRVEGGTPDGDVTPWDELRFAFDASLRDRGGLEAVRVERASGEGPLVEERYECTSSGAVEVRLSVVDEGYAETFRIARPVT